MIKIISVIVLITLAVIAVKILLGLVVATIYLVFYATGAVILGFLGYFIYGKFVDQKENEATKIVEDFLGKKNEKDKS